jgi:serine/threonine protein kinase
LLGSKLGDGGRYEVIEQIGEGGMGEVFLVEDHRLHKRMVIKRLHPQYANNERVRTRFRNEALIQAKLDHPHIVRAVDLLESEDLFGIIIEYVDGPSLEEHLAQEGALSAQRAVAILDPVARAVDYAHANGVVHRDLKPGNILLDRSKGYEVPKVTDFGIAKLVDDKRGATRAGSILGTVAYMSPEQIRGELDVDFRTDIYALGAVVYQLLSGELPFGDATDLELAYRVLSGDPPGTLVGYCERGAEMDALIARAMATDREQRYGTAMELVGALHAVVNRAPAIAAKNVPSPTSKNAPTPSGSVPNAGPKTATLVEDHAGPQVAHNEAAPPPPKIVEDRATSPSTEIEPAGGAALPKAVSRPPALTVLRTMCGYAPLVAVLTAVAWWALSTTPEATRDVDRQPVESSVAAKGAEPVGESAPEPVVPTGVPTVEPTTTESAIQSAPSGFVKVAAGRFSMGSPTMEDGRDDDETSHEVTISGAFWMQRHEVTQEQWQSLMGNNPSKFSGCSQCPVENVNWWEVLAYANKLSRRQGLALCYTLHSCWGEVTGTPMECDSVDFMGLSCEGYRLPTEAEWEYVARSGTVEPRYGELNAIAWHLGNSGRKTHPVGQKRPNAWGVHDMLGNVWEWTWDSYSGYSDSSQRDPVGPAAGTYRVYRGGSWFSKRARYVRVANRYGAPPRDQRGTVGCRLARSIP